MPVSQAQLRAVAKYKKENYRRIPLDVPIEYHEYIKARAKQDGQKVNEWIKQAIDQRMQNVSEEIPNDVITNLKRWLIDHGHTLDDYIDCLQYLGHE